MILLLIPCRGICTIVPLDLSVMFLVGGVSISSFPGADRCCGTSSQPIAEESGDDGFSDGDVVPLAGDLSSSLAVAEVQESSVLLTGSSIFDGKERRSIDAEHSLGRLL